MTPGGTVVADPPAPSTTGRPTTERTKYPRRLTERVMARLAAGHTVRPEDLSLGVRTISRVLGLSEEYVGRLIDEGRLPNVVDGRNRRRVPLAAVYAFKKQFDAERRQALTDLVALSQELGLYE